MSALQTAVVARLKAALAGVAVFDAPPVRGGLPHVVVEEPVLGDWSTKSWTGREGRLSVSLHDAGERPARLRALVEAAEGAVETMPAALGEGWRLVRVTLVRSRIVRGPKDQGADRWRATSEFQVRLYREN